jgi:hypothetical protein
MGADWIKFRVRSDADAAEVRELVAFVNEQYPHGRWIVTPLSFADDDATRSRWMKAFGRLQTLLVFPRGDLPDSDYWTYTALTDSPGMNVEVAFGSQASVVPQLADVDICRVYVISHNPVFPIEWRDEAYRVILPAEFPGFLSKWREYIDEVHAGQWQQYLHELYLYDRLTDEHQYQEFENLVNFATESSTRANAWCHKEGLSPIRDSILRFNVFEQLKALREATTWPRFSDAMRTGAVTTEHLRKEARYLELRQSGTVQIKEWSRLVPQKWKVQFPAKLSFDDFLGHAESDWVKGFFAWCEWLLDGEYGLFLWA